MRKNIHLFIGDSEVEFKTTPDILYNYSIDDLTNPTAVKNSFSKTIVIEGTKNNDRLFGHYWNLERFQAPYIGFNASRKTPFSIYVNGDLYESGYVKLNEVRRTGERCEYEIQLFGGLGEFFYNLTYRDDDEAGDSDKRKLSDLHFMTWDTSTNPADEFDFVINKETLDRAWNIYGPETNNRSMWHYINFAPCYNGKPDDFDADKALINFNGMSGIVSAVTEDGKHYEDYGGYSVATMDRERTEAEMREFRSYLQRPVVRVKEVINACCAPENNGGYTVNLDNKFFNSANPYWENSWCTLPLLTSFDYIGQQESSGATLELGGSVTGGTRTGGMGYVENHMLLLDDIDNNNSFSVSLKINLKVNVESGWYSSGNIYPCAYSVASDVMYLGSIFAQIVAYDLYGNAVAGSEMLNLTSGYWIKRTGTGARMTTTTYFPVPADYGYTMPYGNTYRSIYGGFHKLADTQYEWVSNQGGDLRMDISKIPAGSTLKLVITKICKFQPTFEGTNMILWERESGAGESVRYTGGYMTDFDVEIEDYKITFDTGESIRTGSKFKKSNLLNTDYTPCDFLLSYAKIFGLYFLKDTYSDTISILSRGSFYQTGNTVDIERLIDRSKTQTMKPIAFDAKWYDWALETEDSEFGKNYENTYGISYGKQKINTGYNFDGESKDLYDGNIFKTSVQALERSDSYAYVGRDTSSKPWMYNGFEYLLYNQTDVEDTHNVEVKPKSTINAFSGFTEDYKYYDLFDKVQFHTADNSPSGGENVLLLYNGKKSTSLGQNVTLKYYLTDDNSFMNLLNDGKPCWLLTNDEYDANGIQIAIQQREIPMFGRYQIGDNGVITKSLDFGEPKELYIPYAISRKESTIYTQYWRDYIADLYDTNTRVLKLYLKFEERPTVEWLRRFYWFDNSIWRINKITDWNMASYNTTECEFVKVLDRSAYGSHNVSLYLTGPDTISVTGGTVQLQVVNPLEVRWYASDRMINRYNCTPASGHTEQLITVTVPANTGTTSSAHTFEIYDDNNIFYTWRATQLSETLILTGNTHMVDINGGVEMLQVLSSTDWLLDSEVPWITLSPTAGTGDMQIAATYQRNDSGVGRTGYINARTLQGRYAYPWFLTQAASEYYLRIDIEELNVPANPGSTVYTVNVESDVEWWCSLAEDWVYDSNIGDGEVFRGNFQHRFKIYKNRYSVNPQWTIMTYSSFDSSLGLTAAIRINQAGQSEPFITIESGRYNLDPEGEEFSIIVYSNVPWTITKSQSWLPIPVTAGTGYYTQRVTAPAYTGHTVRNIVITASGSGQTDSMTLTQAASSYVQFTGTTHTPSMSGETIQLTVTSNDSWTLDIDVDWIHCTPLTGNSGTTIITVVVDPNETMSGRTGYINAVTSQGIYSINPWFLTQYIANEWITCTPERIDSVPQYPTDTYTVQIESNAKWRFLAGLDSNLYDSNLDPDAVHTGNKTWTFKVRDCTEPSRLGYWEYSQMFRTEGEDGSAAAGATVWIRQTAPLP